ncbi:tetratricopeptide repeat protein [Streptomyces sp. 549]|uniref:ATP-binding protein n=1 Tax=Streptomyces sp. 549 TaxID=3049076 RepID=UPI0024C2F49C|nr:tetratricopeptide repeat protein [Streptomyces sp. 549]MDK1473404.1 tetratricopeptide repeat protein [Streptomyces sp. 549]
MRHFPDFPDFPADPPPARLPGHAWGNLPAEFNEFVGRGPELAALADRLRQCRLVTVTGTGGVGKSRLAVRAARDQQDRFCDGVWLVDASTVLDSGLLPQAVADTLGLTDGTDRPVLTVLGEHLAGRRALLLLDGVEHLVEECAALVHHLLRAAPELRVLATGRRPLELPGEQVLPLDPLPVPGEDAVELFTRRAAAVVPGFPADAGEQAAAVSVCRHLDGIPLALELAAGRMRALSVTQLLHRLDDRFQVLTGSGRGVPARHRTLRTAVGWSHELCTPQERLLWARLSVFTGHFGLEAAEYVCVGPDLAEEDVFELLAELVTQSVVVRERHADEVRYRMLDTVREYGADWLDALGGTERMRRRHRDWYLGLATWCELDWFGPRQLSIKKQIDAELPNLRAAMEFSLDCGEEAHLGQHLASSLWFYWVGCGRLTEGRHWLDRALEVSSARPGSRLKTLWVTGYAAVLQGDTAGAVAALMECREGAEAAGDSLAAAYAGHRTGCMALLSDDMPRAERLFREALERYREAGELNSNVLMGQVELAMTLAHQGDLAGAVDLCEDVVEVCGRFGERWALAYALHVLAWAAWADGEARRASDLLTECLAIHHTFGDLLGLALSLELFALVTAGLGDPGEAALLQGAAGRLWPSVGPKLFGSRYFHVPHLRCEELARAALGDAGYELRRREGEGLDLPAVVRRVLPGAAPEAETCGNRMQDSPAAPR